MSYSASYVQERLKNELINYIKSQYFGKNPLLMQAIKDKLGAEGLLFQKPYIESSPAYKIDKNGFEKSGLDPWLKDFFLRLSKANLGIYPSPYTHQIKALEEFINGKDIFVATGTGLVKQNVLCGRCSPKWLTKPRIMLIPGKKEAFVLLFFIL